MLDTQMRREGSPSLFHRGQAGLRWGGGSNTVWGQIISRCLENLKLS